MTRVLRKLCVPEEDIYRENQRWFTRINRCATSDDGWGCIWTVVTSGKGMLGIRDGGRMGDAVVSSAVCGQFITKSPVDPIRVHLGDLRLWLGPRRLERCRDCRGRGCEECDRGRVWPERQCVRLWPGGSVYDPQLLSTWMPKALGAGWVTMGPMKMVAHDATKPLLVDGTLEDGTEWRSAVMPMDAKKEQLALAPTYYPGIGGLWHLRNDCHRRGILRDWCMERGLDLEKLDPLPF